MLTGLAPFHPLRDVEISYKVLHGDRPAKPTNASDLGISAGLWQLLVRCWNADDTRRPRVNEIFEHLCQEPARWSIFPPSRLPRPPSSENISMSATHKHGNSQRFLLTCSRAYPSVDGTFHTAFTANVQTPTEGTRILGATSLRSDLSEEIPRPTWITTPPGSRNLDSLNVEVGDSRTFDSAARIRVVFSEPSPGSLDVAFPAQRAAFVQPATGRVMSEDLLQIRPLEPPRERPNLRPSTGPSSGAISVEPTGRLGVLLDSPPQNTPEILDLKETEAQRDSTCSFSSPPPDEPRNDAGSSQGIPEAEASTTPIPGHELGSQPRSKVPDRSEGGKIGATFPRSGMRRIVPGWGASEGKSGEKGKGGGNRSYLPIPTDHVASSNKVEDQVLTPVSPTQQGMKYTTQNGVLILIQRSRSSFQRLFTKLGVRDPSQLRSSPQPGSSGVKNGDGET